MIQANRLRIALVSAYPPSTGPLSEYAWHLVESLRKNPRVEKLWLLSDRAPGAHAYVDERLDVRPCWDFGSPDFPLKTIRAARRLNADLLWFNLHMTSTGNSRAAWFAGVSAPALARLAGFKVLVTLHNMLGLTNLSSAGFRAKPWDICAAHLATGLLCRGSAVCVLRREYASLLKRWYKARAVFYMPHGMLGQPLATNVPRSRTDLLAFGHFGTYKRLEPLIEALTELNLAGHTLRAHRGGD